TTEYQSHAGAVVPGTTPNVAYAYSAVDTNNRSRPTGMTYPNGRMLSYNYTGAGIYDGNISRVSSISDATGVLDTDSYLRLGTVVVRATPATALTYLAFGGNDAGDQYTGLDRFGRVVDQRWQTNAGAATDDFLYGYDRDGNRLFRDNLVNPAFGELY